MVGGVLRRRGSSRIPAGVEYMVWITGRVRWWVGKSRAWERGVPSYSGRRCFRTRVTRAGLFPQRIMGRGDIVMVAKGSGIGFVEEENSHEGDDE